MSHKIFRLFFVLILIVGLVVVAAPQSARAAGPWYVATTGDNANNCLSPTTPCATINGAIDKPTFGSGDTIFVAEGTYLGSLSQPVIVTTNLGISGGWNSSFTTQIGFSTIDGQNLQKLFVVANGVISSFDHLILQNAGNNQNPPHQAGAIYNSGNLTITNSIIQNSVANYGGGIYNEGSLTLFTTTVRNNSSSGQGIQGGGIYNVGNLILNNSIVSGNTSLPGFTSYGIGNLNGSVILNNSTVNGNTGGIINSNGSMILNNSTVNNNTVVNGSGGGIANTGGTLTLNTSTVLNNHTSGGCGGGIYFGDATVTIENSVVMNNSVTGNGGGICSVNNSASLIIRNSTISGNSAAEINFSGGRGGGIYSGGSLTIQNTNITNNDARDAGGIEVAASLLNMQNSTVSDNTALFGAGIVNRFGTVTITESIFSGNSAFHAGGGIWSVGMLTVSDSTFIGNSASNGAGIDHGFETLTVTNTTFSGNNAGSDGGAIANRSQGTLITTNSTFSGNRAGTAGIGIGDGGGIFNLGTVFVNNSTLVNNSAGRFGGGVGNFGTITLQNTILSGNTNGVAPDCSGTIGSAGYNLIGNTSNCNFIATVGDLINTGISLGSLQNNGGPTFTHALLPGSPAIDAGNPAGCKDQNGNLLTTDQRDVTRPQGARCDIGAFELEATGGVEDVSIDIIPGSQSNLINRNSLATIAVAILSSADFNAVSEVDRTSLTFGRTGDELSLVSCNNKGKDVNGDGLMDLVCNFNPRLAGFQISDTVGILKGKTVSGILIEGQDMVKIVKK